MDSTLPHLKGLTGTLIGLLMDSHWEMPAREAILSAKLDHSLKLTIVSALSLTILRSYHLLVIPKQ